MNAKKDEGYRLDPKSIVKVNYLKSSHFRVIYAEGIWGCVTPGLGIQIAFWNERFPIPENLTYEVLEDGRLVERTRDISSEMVREVEASVVINADTAEILIDWLKERVEEIHEMEGAFSEIKEGEIKEDETVE